MLNLNEGVNKRVASVRSVGYSEVFILSADDLLQGMDYYPGKCVSNFTLKLAKITLFVTLEELFALLKEIPEFFKSLLFSQLI